MTFGRLLLRNCFYHWRGNLAVLLGVVVGTAVLTGALLVGDSVPLVTAKGQMALGTELMHHVRFTQLVLPPGVAPVRGRGAA